MQPTLSQPSLHAFCGVELEMELSGLLGKAERRVPEPPTLFSAYTRWHIQPPLILQEKAIEDQEQSVPQKLGQPQRHLGSQTLMFQLWKVARSKVTESEQLGYRGTELPALQEKNLSWVCQVQIPPLSTRATLGISFNLPECLFHHLENGIN